MAQANEMSELKRDTSELPLQLKRGTSELPLQLKRDTSELKHKPSSYAVNTKRGARIPMSDNENKTNEIYEISLLDLFTVLVKRRKYIAKIAMRVVLLAIVYSLIATPVFKSEMRVMPSGGQKGGGMMAMLAASGLGSMLGGSGFTTTADTVVGIMKSPAVLDRVIESKQLLTREEEGFSIGKIIRSVTKKEMEPRSLEKTRKALGETVSAEADIKTGLITLSVGARTPEFSQELTQAVFDETQAVMRTVATSPSAQSKLVLQQQIKDAGDELAKAEAELAKYNIQKVSLGDTPADVTALARLQAAMLAKEVELRTAKAFGTDQNPKVKILQAEYDALKREFEADTAAESVNEAQVGSSSDKFDYTAKLRDYKLKEKTYDLLLAQLQSAKVNEDDLPLVIQQVGDPTLPEKRAKPQRKKIVILATLLGIFIGIFAALAKHFYELGCKDEETAPQINYIRDALTGDWTAVKNKLRRKK